MRALVPDYLPKNYVPSSEEVPPTLADNLVPTHKTKESRAEEDKTEEGQTKKIKQDWPRIWREDES